MYQLARPSARLERPFSGRGQKLYIQISQGNKKRFDEDLRVGLVLSTLKNQTKKLRKLSPRQTKSYAKKKRNHNFLQGSAPIFTQLQYCRH